MTIPHRFTQFPPPGSRRLLFRGDTITFVLESPSDKPASQGRAYLRTNIGHAAEERQEVIREVIKRFPKRGRSWYDIPMRPISDHCFEVTLLLAEVGHFEAKCCYIPEGALIPLWPEGENTVVNVAPADTCCANIIYNAFVRQFGPNKAGLLHSPTDDQYIRRLDRSGYTVIPKSGAFRDLKDELDFIIGQLGCRVILLLPINPTPTIYARMGRFGSPYAALSHTAVDPALAEFDPRCTPLEQFMELADAIHVRGAKLFLDIAVNHTGWAAALHETHPEWLARDEDGRIINPGAWGIVWEDLTKLDYSRQDLWRYVADVFLTWCNRGVDGFRCDAGYMIPIPAWKYITARVRNAYPDTVFFLEGLGGPLKVTRDLLNIGGFNWAYSELFQNYDRGQIEAHLALCNDIIQHEGLMIHFAETHDNNRLAATSSAYARMRTALCAMLSGNGGFGFTNGVEWLAAEKIDVHGAPSLNWNGEPNLVEHIRRINAILAIHPAFHDQAQFIQVNEGPGNRLAYLRKHPPTGRKVLVLANLSAENAASVAWNHTLTGLRADGLIDLLTAQPVATRAAGHVCAADLPPGTVYCLTDEPQWLEQLRQHLASQNSRFYSPRIELQRLKAKALDVYRYYHGNFVADVRAADFDPVRFAQDFSADPADFCRRQNPAGNIAQVTAWHWPHDLKRQVMLPPGHFLIVYADSPFSAFIKKHRQTLAHEASFEAAPDRHFCLFAPLPERNQHTALSLHLTGLKHTQPIETPLLLLAPYQAAQARYHYTRKDIMEAPLLFMDTNGRGGMLRAQAAWGELHSRYDALLAANLNPEYPDERRVMLSRCRAWALIKGFSQEIRADCLEDFSINDDGVGQWRFRFPAGQGRTAILAIQLRMADQRNAVRLRFERQAGAQDRSMIEDEQPLRLIIRPDIEDRSFHETTKAFLGPEAHWPAAIQPQADGFAFVPCPARRLEMRVSKGGFAVEPEWHYMVYRAIEAERGLDPHSDLFSPGYFTVDLTGGEGVELQAQAVISAAETGLFDQARFPAEHEEIGSFAKTRFLRFDEGLLKALSHYVVKRGQLRTVIAGYPWFLDWGRDTLIVLRGLIAAGRLAEARDALLQFAEFEDHGSIPNMIRGNDVGDRDTSDGPLWFAVVCADLIAAEGSDALLNIALPPVADAPHGKPGRTVRDVLISLGNSLCQGAKNGVRRDPETGLLFSPSHFTWMDTNHPAGTPRQGYPVEIQALWIFALNFLSRIEPERREHWRKLAAQAKQSLLALFWLKTEGYLADCLYAQPGQSALTAEVDDALRPNQLYAITTGAVDDPEIGRKMLSACEALMVPGGMRSLANRPVKRPLPIQHHGRLLNDPHHPYWGNYRGDEDTRRKPAYHNGTAWVFVFPIYCEAYSLIYGQAGHATALAWLSSATLIMNQGCIGHLPEILDGDAPHAPKGCDAQAWSASEFLRVWKLLTP